MFNTGQEGPIGQTGPTRPNEPARFQGERGYAGVKNLDCYTRNPQQCHMLEYIQFPMLSFVFDGDGDLLRSLKLGHIGCSRKAISNERNARTLNISILFEDGDRSANRLPALELLLEFNFPFDMEKMMTMHEESPFCEEIMDFLNRRGIPMIPKRLAFTKSAAK